MRPINRHRCPAPVHTEWGSIRCVHYWGRCAKPGHARWRLIAWPMALVWSFRSWWPTAQGRAADRAGRRESGVRHSANGRARAEQARYRSERRR